MSPSDDVQTPGSSCAPGTLEEELQQIEREQSEAVDLEEKERELDEMNRRARMLTGELRAARTSRRKRSAENALPVIHPREPCTSAWEDMSGDERVRACGRCKTRVYDLGGLDPTDARRLLSEHEGRLPTHVVGRVDGTVTAESCTEKRRRLSPLAIGLAISGAAGLLISGMAIGYMLNGPPEMVEVTDAQAPIEVEALVDELVQARMAEALEKAKAEAPPPTPPTPPTPPAAPPKAESNDDGRSERRKRRRCRRRARIYDPWASPLFFFWDSAYSGEVEPTCDAE